MTQFIEKKFDSQLDQEKQKQAELQLLGYLILIAVFGSGWSGNYLTEKIAVMASAQYYQWTTLSLGEQQFEAQITPHTYQCGRSHHSTCTYYAIDLRDKNNETWVFSEPLSNTRSNVAIAFHKNYGGNGPYELTHLELYKGTSEKLGQIYYFSKADLVLPNNQIVEVYSGNLRKDSKLLTQKERNIFWIFYGLSLIGCLLGLILTYQIFVHQKRMLNTKLICYSAALAVFISSIYMFFKLILIITLI